MRQEIAASLWRMVKAGLRLGAQLDRRLQDQYIDAAMEFNPEQDDVISAEVFLMKTAVEFPSIGAYANTVRSVANGRRKLAARDRATESC